jgi:hypothetical protein
VAGGGEQEGGRRGAKVGVRRYKLLKDVLCWWMGCTRRGR